MAPISLRSGLIASFAHYCTFSCSADFQQCLHRRLSRPWQSVFQPAGQARRRDAQCARYHRLLCQRLSAASGALARCTFRCRRRSRVRRQGDRAGPESLPRVSGALYCPVLCVRCSETARRSWFTPFEPSPIRLKMALYDAYTSSRPTYRSRSTTLLRPDKWQRIDLVRYRSGSTRRRFAHRRTKRWSSHSFTALSSSSREAARRTMSFALEPCRPSTRALALTC